MNSDNGNNGERRRIPTSKSDESTKRVIARLSELAVVLGTEPEEGMMERYPDALSDLTPAQIDHGFDLAARYFKPDYGRKLPAPAEIRAWAEQLVPDETIRQAAIDSDEINSSAIPKGWTEEDVRRARVTLRVAREKSRRPFEADSRDTVAFEPAPESPSSRKGDLTHVADIDPALLTGLPEPFRQEMIQLLNDAKGSQREHIARLEADPRWRDMAKRLGGYPGLKPKLKESSVPTDPVARAKWAHDMAIRQGWIEPDEPAREPGDEEAEWQ